MDEIKKNKFREIINQYINKTQYILRYIKNTVCEKEEDRLMQDMMEIFFSSKLYVFENALFAMEQNMIGQFLGDVTPADMDYNIEYIAHFEAIREINYEFNLLIN